MSLSNRASPPGNSPKVWMVRCLSPVRSSAARSFSQIEGVYSERRLDDFRSVVNRLETRPRHHRAFGAGKDPHERIAPIEEKALPRAWGLSRLLKNALRRQRVAPRSL